MKKYKAIALGTVGCLIFFTAVIFTLIEVRNVKKKIKETETRNFQEHLTSTIEKTLREKPGAVSSQDCIEKIILLMTEPKNSAPGIRSGFNRLMDNYGGIYVFTPASDGISLEANGTHSFYRISR